MMQRNKSRQFASAVQRRDRADRAATAAGPTPAASKAFSKHFQIQPFFLQGFPKNALVISWDFKGLQ